MAEVVPEPFEVGDNVYVGEGRVHWIIRAIVGENARLESGMTGIKIIKPLSILTLHSKEVKPS